jgi:phosphatidylinositol 4-phosphatase
MGRLKGHMIYKVIATEFLPLRERPLHDQDEDNYLVLLKTFIKSGPMYFSYSFDITNTFQRQSQLDPSVPLWKRADDRFFWNKFVQSDLIDFRTSGSRHQHGQQPGVDPYILPVMFGMLEIISTRIKSTPLTMVLITRRSRHRAGTRYFSRGIDEEGHVSNFNETEQVIVLNDSTGSLGGFAGGGGMQNGKVGGSGGKEVQIMSYVQTRGSVPVYWAEVNTLHYTPKLQVRGVESAVSAARTHFSEQIRLYGDNYLVNLVNQKGREKRVKDAYEQIVKLLVSSPSERKLQDSISDEKFHIVEPSGRRQEFDRLHYVYFDFHNETKGLKWHRAQLLLDELNEGLENQQYFRGVDMPADPEGRLEVRNHQTSVVRTNCMDCLDRTNVVQSMLARWTLNRQLSDLGVLSRGESFTLADPEFEVLFRKLWADNADIVSKSYSGTGALKTDFTRTGKRTKAGAFQDLQNSITRYVRNNFLDGPKQDAFDLFLGAYLPQPSSYMVFADKRPLLIQSIPYILAFSMFFVFVGTFTRRLPDAAVLPVRIFIFFWFLVGAWSLNFIYRNGMLYVSPQHNSTTVQVADADKLQVNWPKLNPRPWATEGYHEAISNVRKDKLIGPLVTRHERGLSTARYTNAEEGKKRIE